MSDEMTIQLTGKALQTVRDLAAAQGLTVAELLRQAISHEQWLADEKKSGSRIIAENREAKERRELVH